MDEQVIQAWVRTGRAIAAEITELTKQKTEVEEKLRAVVPVGDRLVVDGVPVIHKRGNRSFNEKRALAMLTATEREACVKLGVDGKLVRSFADANGITEACMDDPKPDAKTTLQLAG